MKSMCLLTQSPGLWAIILMLNCTQNRQTRIDTFYPQAATRNTAAEIFRIVWLSVSGVYAQILIHLSLGQQSYRTNFEDEVTTYNQFPPRPRKPGHKEETTCFATSQGTLIPFVLTYHPELPKVKEIVNKHWPIIESSKRLNKVSLKSP